MKKFFIAVLLIVSIVGICLLSHPGQEQECNEYLRMHIRADSNDEKAQAVKYLVRDRVVEYLTPTVAGCGSKQAAMERLGNILGEIEDVAEDVLRENGFSYGARASLRKESFPTRVYENVTLEAGVYDALIIELGSGAGDNWWCVVYPPLCFGGQGTNIVYKSKIKEIIDSFFAQKEDSRKD